MSGNNFQFYYDYKKSKPTNSLSIKKIEFTQNKRVIQKC